MTVFRKALDNRWLLLFVRLALGAVFAYAGVLKMRSPLDFSDSIASFRILPDEMINILAIALPPFEILVGGCSSLAGRGGPRRWPR